MKSKIWSVFLTAATAAGCSVGPEGRGDVLFSWSFDGVTSCADASVTSVVIDIPGERLENNGVYPCSSNGFAGIVLRDFFPGNYSFTIAAADATNRVLYQTAASFRVFGNVQVPVDLLPSSALANSNAQLFWSFPPNGTASNPSCAQAGLHGIVRVDVQVDRGRIRSYPCTDGQNAAGALVSGLFPGGHTIRVDAFSFDSNYPYYSATGPLDTVANTTVSASVPLQWAVGGVAVRWQFGPGQSCGSTGLSTVYVNFADVTGVLLFPAPGDPQGCSAGASVPILYDYLPAGTYTLSAQGNAGGRAYAATASGVTINPGQFANPAQAVVLTLQ